MPPVRIREEKGVPPNPVAEDVFRIPVGGVEACSGATMIEISPSRKERVLVLSTTTRKVGCGLQRSSVSSTNLVSSLSTGNFKLYVSWVTSTVLDGSHSVAKKENLLPTLLQKFRETRHTQQHFSRSYSNSASVDQARRYHKVVGSSLRLVPSIFGDVTTIKGRNGKTRQTKMWTALRPTAQLVQLDKRFMRQSNQKLECAIIRQAMPL